jgi:cytochrome c556
VISAQALLRSARSIAVLVGLWSCAGNPGSPAPVRDPAHPTALGSFMKDQVNPAFTRLSFLLFHDDDRELDLSAFTESANELARAAGGLAAWSALPGESEQSKLVFHEYADWVKADTGRLVESLRDNQIDNARRLFESLHQKCDACHHFFRYDQATLSPR